MKFQHLQYVVIIVAIIFLGAAFVVSNTGSGADAGVPSPIQTANQTPTVTPSAGTIEAAAMSKVVIDVQGMSCSGCIYTIKSSLADMTGIRDVLVDLSSGEVAVYVDSQSVTDADKMAAAITASGYPATVAKTLSAKELARENSVQNAKSKLYIAAVGDWEISRDDYSTELSHARRRYEKVYGSTAFSGDQGQALMTSLKAQIVGRLIDEGIQMQEVRKAGYKLSPEVLENEFSEFLKQKGMTAAAFQRLLTETGYSDDYFQKKFENRVTISRYLTDNVIPAMATETEKRQHYADWYNNARLLAKVDYYDRELEAIVKNAAASSGSGCGNSCSRQ